MSWYIIHVKNTENTISSSSHHKWMFSDHSAKRDARGGKKTLKFSKGECFDLYEIKCQHFTMFRCNFNAWFSFLPSVHLSTLKLQSVLKGPICLRLVLSWYGDTIAHQSVPEEGRLLVWLRPPETRSAGPAPETAAVLRLLKALWPTPTSTLLS